MVVYSDEWQPAAAKEFLSRAWITPLTFGWSHHWHVQRLTLSIIDNFDEGPKVIKLWLFEWDEQINIALVASSFLFPSQCKFKGNTRPVLHAANLTKYNYNYRAIGPQLKLTEVYACRAWNNTWKSPPGWSYVATAGKTRKEAYGYLDSATLKNDILLDKIWNLIQLNCH